MRRRALVRVRWLRVAAEYRQQSDKRQHDYDFSANPIDPLCIHVLTLLHAARGAAFSPTVFLSARNLVARHRLRQFAESPFA